MAEGRPLEVIKQTLTNVAPHEVPRRIWSLIETHFEQKYRVRFSEAFPQGKAEQPTIVWRVLRRRPGGGKDGVLQARGPSFSHQRGVDGQGFVHEVQTQTHRVTYEFAVFAASTEEADNIAWDLEQALWQVIGRIQEELPGFHLAFSEAGVDLNMAWTKQDDLMVRILRYEAVVPVRYEELVPELKKIQLVAKVGAVLKERIKFQRTSAEARFDIPVEDGDHVALIYFVFLDNGSGLKPLVGGVDYEVRKDTETLLPYIHWLDDYGATPAVGENFRVSYEITPLVTSRDITR